MSEESEALHILGKISGYYGVKGWVKIYSYTQPRENIVRYKALKIKFGNIRLGSNNNGSNNNGSNNNGSNNNVSNKSKLNNSLTEDSQWQDIELDSGKAHGKGVVAHFAGYDDRDAAAHLMDAELAISRSEFKSTAKNEYYWTDLIGLMAINLQDIELGQVKKLIETAANDVLVISPSSKNDSGSEILVPFVLQHYVKQVDLDRGTIVVDWPVDWNESS